MKQNKSSHQQNKKPTRALRPTTAAEIDPSALDFAPSLDEVAKRAYFSYVNQGSLPGYDLQHWLEAEAHLLTEQNITLAPGLQNRT